VLAAETSFPSVVWNPDVLEYRRRQNIDKKLKNCSEAGDWNSFTFLASVTAAATGIAPAFFAGMALASWLDMDNEARWLLYKLPRSAVVEDALFLKSMSPHAAKVTVHRAKRGQAKRVRTLEAGEVLATQELHQPLHDTGNSWQSIEVPRQRPKNLLLTLQFNSKKAGSVPSCLAKRGERFIICCARKLGHFRRQSYLSIEDVDEIVRSSDGDICCCAQRKKCCTTTTCDKIWH